MAAKHRRVVTGHDEGGRSIILTDGYALNSKTLVAAGGLQRTELWEARSAPADNRGNRDAAAETTELEPQWGGNIFRIVEYPPDSVRLKTIDPSAHFGVAADRSGKYHRGMHKTNTIDYVIILSGEIYAVMEEGEVLLRSGDTLIQRGTNHAWSNRSDQPCVIAFVMVSALPLV